MTTKGEALLTGMEQIQDGLEMIARLGDKEALMITLTVKKVIDDFMDVLFDLSMPYKAEEDSAADQVMP